MRFVFDIDNTVCDTTDTNYEKARPREQMVALINELYDSGHHITFFTARGMGTLKEDVQKVYDVWYDITFEQLTKWGFKFDRLLLGKPTADLYVDDKAFGADGSINCDKLKEYIYGNLIKPRPVSGDGI